MRKTLNENPVAQIAVLGVLAVLVGFLLLTRMSGRSGGDSSASPTTASEAAATPAPAIDSTSSATPSAATDSAPSATSPDEAPSTTSPSVPSSDSGIGEFVAGPGLPATVVKAYADDKTVVLLILRHGGIDDDELRQNVERLRGRNDLALFATNAGHVARYSRITQGVNMDRVPALIVLRPRHLTRGTPRASLSYGVRGPESVDQAIRDALYKGPTNLPYHPK